MLFDWTSALDVYAGTVDNMTLESDPKIVLNQTVAAIAPSSASILNPGRRGVGTRSLRGSYGISDPLDTTVPWRTSPAAVNDRIGGYTPDASAIGMRFWFRTSSAFAGMRSGPGQKWIEYWWPNQTNRNQTSWTRLSGNTYIPEIHSGVQRVALCPWNAILKSFYADDAWHRFTVIHKPQTGTNEDGIGRVWIDGVQVLDCSALRIGQTPANNSFGAPDRVWCSLAEVQAYSTQPINHVRWLETMSTPGPTAAYDEDIDTMQVWQITNS